MSENFVHIPDDYVERVYAGWLGKVIGVRHGSNIEGWSSKAIADVYGEITGSGYLFDFKNFASDDDTNGPLFYIRALEDYTHTRELTAGQIGKTWLNYVPYEHGFYWWGGYGVATEHTAYLNLRAGIPAPRSGSIEQNGFMIAEQIGGQIFIDTWGLVVPSDYKLAAEYAQKAASVSHGGNGIYGGMFIAACISAAFVEKDIASVIKCGLETIPEDCEYTKMSKDVIAFYESNPEDWQKCLKYVQDYYGYDRYPGNCHIIPNSAVIVLSLLYGEGDFTRSINICNMCGWDTDCNVGNVGTIVGVFAGLEDIDMNWRRPVNDLLICSSVIGSMNIRDIPHDAYYIARLGYLIAGENPPDKWAAISSKRGKIYDFKLPGSTHAFRVRTSREQKTDYVLTHTREPVVSADGALKAGAALSSAGDEMFVYHKTYYRPDDFDDNRGGPSFSPILYPGQCITARVMVSRIHGKAPKINLYVKDDNSGLLHCSEQIDVTPDSWQELNFEIPALDGACLTEAGIKIMKCDSGNRDMLLCYIDEMTFSGDPDYTLNFAKERIEHWGGLQREVSQCTYLKGIWDIDNGTLVGSCADFGEAYTGNPDWADYTLIATLQPLVGDEHRLNFRVQGAIRSYAIGLAPGGKLVLYKNDNGYQKLVEIPYPWEHMKNYTLHVRVEGSVIEISDENGILMKYDDTDKPYLSGQIGFSMAGGSRCAFSDVRVGKV